MIIILIIASIISAVVSKMQGENDYVDSIIIIGIVVFNALMGVIQEAKAEKSIEALKQMTPQHKKEKRISQRRKSLRRKRRYNRHRKQARHR